MMKQIQRYLGFYLFLIFTVSSCGIDTGYKIENESVYYTYWNTGMGFVSKTMRLKDADPNSFVIFDFDAYAKDAHYVYHKGELIEGADAKTFEPIGEHYAKDKERAYYGRSPIEHSHGPTFRIIDPYFSTDGIDVFFEEHALNVEDPANFRFVFPTGENAWQRWSTDGKFYYFNNFKVPSNDYSGTTIYMNSGGISKDRKWAYYLDRKLNFDLEGNRIVDTIDVESFEVTGFIKCRDKYGCFNVYHGRKECN